MILFFFVLQKIIFGYRYQQRYTWAQGAAVNAGLDVVIQEPDVSPLQLRTQVREIALLFGESIRN